MNVQTTGRCHRCGGYMFFPDEQGEPRCHTCGAYPPIETLPRAEVAFEAIRPGKDTGCPAGGPSCQRCQYADDHCIEEEYQRIQSFGICEFCGAAYAKTDPKQRSCSRPECKRALKALANLKRQQLAQ